EINQHRDYSEATAISIDDEVKELINGANDKVKQLLSQHIDLLRALAHELLEKETLTSEDIKVIMAAHSVVDPNAKEAVSAAAAGDGHEA
ncbi:MAG: cell division protein FtsH, partial [Desulfobulbaceae bacterium]|nr:cell division protein FtsH [Desulfobulbaceae bacterium]